LLLLSEYHDTPWWIAIIGEAGMVASWAAATSADEAKRLESTSATDVRNFIVGEPSWAFLLRDEPMSPTPGTWGTVDDGVDAEIVRESERNGT
jgi:hypothetical protein